MKKVLRFLIAISPVLGLSSCKKEKYESNPLVGKVYEKNSNTPIDRALVRFIKTLPSNWLGPNSYTVTQEVLTNEKGEFIIPDTTSADFIKAWGITSIYGPEPSLEVELPNYLVHGGQPKLYLTPPAWLKVKAVDVAPLNPEVLAIYLNPIGSGSIEWTQSIINQEVTWRINGNDTYTLMGKKAIDDIGQIHFNIELPQVSAFDTLVYTIEF